MKAIIISPNEIPVRVDINRDFEHRLITGDLTENGIQYSGEVTTAGANVDVEVINQTVDPGIEGDILWVEFGLTAEFKAVSSATADLIWKWQARNKSGTWFDLHAQIIETDVGTSYVSRTRSGYASVQSSFNKVPFDIRLILQCNEANQGRAKVKNSSYVRVIYKVV